MRIFLEDLVPGEDKLWRGGAGGALADFVREAEGLGDGEEGDDGVEGGSFFEGFGKDAAAASCKDVVDATEDFGWVILASYSSCDLTVPKRKKGRLTASLYLTRVHGKQQSWTPIQKALFDSSLHGFDHLACQPAQLIARRGFIVRRGVDGDFFEENGDALNRFIAKRSLNRCKLERVADFVGEVLCLECVTKRLVYLL